MWYLFSMDTHLKRTQIKHDSQPFPITKFRGIRIVAISSEAQLPINNLNRNSAKCKHHKTEEKKKQQHKNQFDSHMFIPSTPIKFYYIQSNFIACVIRFSKNLCAI